VVLGIVITILAVRFFKQAHTTVRPFERSNVLAVGSIYWVSRNPMYLGYLLILVGIAILLGAVSPWLVVAGFTVLLQCVFICVEERLLEEEFGALWKGYCKHTRRWL
jgi:protein-S-isoprenylcysteine O-methyltransferase Ste14